MVARIPPCVICMDPPEEPVTTPCQHTFCRGCLRGLLLQGKGATSTSERACPLCRRDVAAFLRRGDALATSAPFAGILAKGCGVDVGSSVARALRCGACALPAEDAVVTPCCGACACYWCL